MSFNPKMKIHKKKREKFVAYNNRLILPPADGFLRWNSVGNHNTRDQTFFVIQNTIFFINLDVILTRLRKFL